MGEFIRLFIIAAGIVLLFYYFDRDKMSKKEIIPSILVLFVLIVLVNYIKDLL